MCVVIVSQDYQIAADILETRTHVMETLLFMQRSFTLIDLTVLVQSCLKQQPKFGHDCAAGSDGKNV